MNNPFDYTPDEACDAAFRELTASIETIRRSGRPEDINFCRELDGGKMLGVLVAVDAAGARHTLFAFSGQLGYGGFRHNGFVEPVFDYLQPDGYFKTEERRISRQNEEIAVFENETLALVRNEYETAERALVTEVDEYKERCRQSKRERDIRRATGVADEAELASMVRQSQFEKAELHRIKKKMAAILEPLAENLRIAQAKLDSMREKRRIDSEALQQWLFTNFRLLNARGESRSLSDIFADTAMKIPPSGAGECCAPKLLQATYLRGWQPLSIAEYWYGKPKGGEVRMHGRHYPACRGKCLPVLSWMLQGLEITPPLDSMCQPAETPEPEILFENQWFCVVDKPAGMLSVPGKGKVLSVQEWLINKYGKERDVKVAHRLDRDTSGLLIATFGTESFRIMQMLFATREVHKTYIAELDGDYASLDVPQQGRIELPLMPDWLDRPRQRVDFGSGKEAVTEYRFTGVTDGRSRVIFHPHTGRTHQLRVHAASEMGLGMPIAGDPLYGKNRSSGRLRLHAQKIEFTFPPDGWQYCFEIPCPF